MLLPQLRLGTAVFAHPLLDDRPRQAPDVDARIELPPDALDQHHRLLQQQKLRLRLHLELLGHLEQLRQQLGDRDLVQRQVEDRLADRAAGLGERVDRAPPRHIAGLEMHLGDAAGNRRSETRSACPRGNSGSARSSRPMMPKSTTASAPSASTNTFPGCRSAWKKPSRKTWLKKDAGGVVQQVGDRMPGRDQPVAVIDPNAGDALGRQHRAPGAQPIDLRHPEGRVAGEISRPAPMPQRPRTADPFRAAPTR